VNTGSFERTATHVMLVLFAVLALAPLVIVVLAAMHPSGTLLSGAGLPDSFSLSTFRTAWDEGGFSQRRCSRSRPGMRSGRCASRSPTCCST